MFKIWFVAALAVIIVASPLPSEQQDDPEHDNFRLYRGQSRFAVSMIKSLRKFNPRSNIFFSPHSIYRILLRAFIGSGGAMKQSLKEILFLDWAKDDKDVADAYITEKLARTERFSSENFHFKSVDKFYVTKKAMLMSNIKDVFTFDEIERVDFSNLEARRAEINTFVAQNTQNHINELLPINSVQDHQNIFLVNAASFKGFLEKPFNVRNTAYQHFYGASEQIVEMMSTVGMYNYGVLHKEKTAVLELPYEGEGGSVSMFIFLPLEATPTVIDDLVDNLSAETINDAWKIGKSKGYVEISFPKLKLAGEYLLKNVLEDMGVKNLFDSNLFNDIIHKTEKEGNEAGKGVRTASSFKRHAPPEKEVRMGAMSCPNSTKETLDFHCNRPFLYMINDKVTQEVLFAGIYRGPDSENK